MAYIVVFGNEKGGSGKSTTAMHVLAALLRSGKSVGVLDLDVRQRTLTRFVENRHAYCERHDLDLGLPAIGKLQSPLELTETENHEATLALFQQPLLELDRDNEFILIDCAGSHSYLAELAHAMADTLVTPMNDSFIDFDLLARIDPDSNKIMGPSVYSEMVWNARKARAETGARPMEWVVVRNRMSNQKTHNKRRISEALNDLSRRIGFRLVQGFSDRVVFREMFPQGLTLLDLKDIGAGPLNISNVAARQELRELIQGIKLPGIELSF